MTLAFFRRNLMVSVARFDRFAGGRAEWRIVLRHQDVELVLALVLQVEGHLREREAIVAGPLPGVPRPPSTPAERRA